LWVFPSPDAQVCRLLERNCPKAVAKDYPRDISNLWRREFRNTFVDASELLKY
jgi:hypothetical protein